MQAECKDISGGRNLRILFQLFFSKAKLYLNLTQLQVALLEIRHPRQNLALLYMGNNMEEMKVAKVSYPSIDMIYWNIKIGHGQP